MINLEKLEKVLQQNRIQFISGVPDTLLNDFCLYVEEKWPTDKHVLAANEGNAAALAAGYHLATNTVPLVYMQNSGIGNAVNPLISLTHPSVFGIPMILLIGWRGEPGVKDHPQHTKMGQLTPVLLDDMEIPWRRLEDDLDAVEQAFDWAEKKAREISGPVALMVPKGVLERGEKSVFEDQPNLMSREEAIHCIVDTMSANTIFVASTGRAIRELYELRRLRGESHENDFLNVGAMGHTSSIAAGIALAKKDRKVVCLDGDASAIMHMGAMAVIGQKNECENLVHIVLNNGVHESVGGQRAVTSNINLNSVANQVGYETSEYIVDSDFDLKNVLNKVIVSKKNKAVFVEVKIKKGLRKDLPLLNSDFIVQEKIIQHNDLNRLYPNTINTIRFISTYKKGKTKIHFASFRIGSRATKRMDNVSKGGLSIKIILDSGELNSYGYYKYASLAPDGNGIAKQHPDTKTTFEGFKLPYFKEACNLVKKAHGCFKNIYSIGWDVVITPDGPLILEGNYNWCTSAPQLLEGFKIINKVFSGDSRLYLK